MKKNTIFVENNSWTMKFLSCLILMLLFTTSCDNGVKREEKPQALCIDMQNGEKIYLSPDSVVQFERTTFLVPKVSGRGRKQMPHFRLWWETFAGKSRRKLGFLQNFFNRFRNLV